jgi:hypothetical protein
MEAVDILFGSDGEEDALRVDLFGERKLDENAVDFGAAIEIFHQGQEIFGGKRGGRRDGFVANAEFIRGFGFTADVDLGSWIIADENHRKTGRPARMRNNTFDARAAFGFDLIANTISIENQRHDFQISGPSCIAHNRHRTACALLS